MIAYIISDYLEKMAVVNFIYIIKLYIFMLIFQVFS